VPVHRYAPLALESRRRHTRVVVAFILVLGGGLLALMFLTAQGASRRGLALLPALLAGLFFPVTWVVWYVRDEHPYRMTH
jgi:hypothetical protein